jgi:hypothetical protein
MLGWRSDLMKVDTTIVLENRNETLINSVTEINQMDTLVSNIAQPTYDNYLNYMLQSCKGPMSRIQFRYVSTREIEEIIKPLKAKYSHGYDEIPTTIFKVSAPFISSPLVYIVNKSLSSRVYPARLKFAVVKPVFKSGDKHGICNYRPISLLPAFSKVF